MPFNYKKLYAIRQKFDLDPRYDEIPKEPGIYLWTREDNGKTFYYVGQAKNLKNRRFDYYKIQTGLGYPTRHFESSLKAHKDWKYKVIELCSEDKLDERERYWIDYYFKLPNYITRNDSLTTGRDMVKSNYTRIARIEERQAKEIEKCLSHLIVEIKPNYTLVIKPKLTKEGNPMTISVKYFDELMHILGLKKGKENEI